MTTATSEVSSTCSMSQADGLRAGAALARLRWHLTHGLLLDSRPHGAMPSESRPPSRGNHWDAATDVFEEIYQLFLDSESLPFSDGVIELDAVRDDLDRLLRGDECYFDCLYAADRTIRAAGSQEEECVNEERGSIVRGFVSPLVARLRGVVSGGEEIAKFVALGELIEQGIARADVHRQMQPQPQDLLRQDAYTAWLDERICDPEEIQLVLEADPPPAPWRPLVLSPISREPGDLRPAPSWAQRVEHAFRTLEIPLPVDCLESLDTFGGLDRKSRHIVEPGATREDLVALVRRLRESAIGFVGGISERISVDVANRLIYIDGIGYEEELEVVTVFAALVNGEHFDRKNAGFLKHLLADDPLFNGRVKLAEIREKIKNSSLSAILRSAGPVGSWLELPKERVPLSRNYRRSAACN